jgi:hypothetical protein
MIQRYSLRGVPARECLVIDRCTHFPRPADRAVIRARRGYRSAGRRALTFVELLIGLSITAVTCAILATLINATALGTSSQNDGRRALVRLQALKAELAGEFVNARCILAAGNNYVVYWVGDQAGTPVPVNQAVNFSEIRLLQIDPSGNLNVYCARWPDNMLDSVKIAADTTYPANTDWFAAASALKGTSYFTTTTLASNATALAVTLDNAAPTSAHFIHLRIDMNDGIVSREVVLGIALANPAVPW